jgi:hypothetical protein
MGTVMLRGLEPEWFNRDDSGDGYGSDSDYGYGDGYGSGYGAGYGYGSDYGSGYGDGSGDGYGAGSGDGYGSDSDYGSGYGDDSGDGYGAGSGDGSGYGHGDGSYWRATVPYFATKWSAEQRARLDQFVTEGATIAFWRSNKHGLPANGGRSVIPAAPGVVHADIGPLNLCAAGTLHATLIPPRWEGSRWWIVALTGEVAGDDEKLGALRREIIGEAL